MTQHFCFAEMTVQLDDIPSTSKLLLTATLNAFRAFKHRRCVCSVAFACGEVEL
jgi:hypothetical protein